MLRLALPLTVLASPLLGVLIASGGNSVATIAVDLYHAPYPNGLNALVKGCPGCRWTPVIYVMTWGCGL